MFKFIPDHKRCSHISASGGGDDEDGAGDDERDHGSLAGRPTEPTQSATPVLDLETAPRVEDRQSPKNNYLRFVGDLNPEASFLSDQRHRSAVTVGPRRRDVGVWLGQQPQARHIIPKERTTKSARLDSHHSSIRHVDGLTGLKSVSKRLHQECLSALPPAPDLAVLTRVYFTKFDPIFPILRGEILDSHEPLEEAALKQCVCLVAALDPQCWEHLRLPWQEQQLSPIEFRSHISAALKQCLDMEFIQNKVVLLQVTALMGLHAGQASSSEVSSFYVSQAIHHAQTLGIHHGWPEDDARIEKSRRLFWCIWVLDRLNAATNGRPVLMHQQDIEPDKLAAFSDQIPPFKLLIRITKILDKVISQYRPHATVLETPDEAFITFEQLVQETHSSTFGGAILATLEVFYLAVVILRNRPTEQGNQNQPATNSEIQMFAAQNIIAIASGDLRLLLTFWPPLPYAVSLATSIAYKALRRSVLPYRRKTAYSLLNNSCEVLEELGKSFSSPRIIARLASDTTQEVERIAADRGRPLNTHRSSQRATGAHNSAHTTQTRTSTAATSPARIEDRVPTAGSPLGIELDTTNQHTLGSTFDQLDMTSFFDDVAGEAPIFNDFDPDLDLARIDQIFSANLDPTNPVPMQNWLGRFKEYYRDEP